MVQQPGTGATTDGSMFIQTNDDLNEKRIHVTSAGVVDINGEASFSGASTLSKQVKCTETHFVTASIAGINADWDHCLTVIESDGNPASTNTIIMTGSVPLTEGMIVMILNRDDNPTTGAFTIASGELTFVVYTSSQWNKMT